MQVDDGAVGMYPLRHSPLHLLFVFFTARLSVMLLFPLADLASIRLFPVYVGEDELEDLIVPTGWTAFNTLFDVLHVNVSLTVALDYRC